MDYKAILSTYFPQLLLVLGGITYFIKRYFDLKTKKVEIRHSIFQQNRANAVNRFFLSYTRCQRSIESISISRLLNNNYTADELDKIIQENINDLLSDDLTMSLYFDQDLLTKFNLITKNMMRINNLYSDAYIGFISNNKFIHDSSYLFAEMTSAKEENSELLKEIGAAIRASYNAE
jgi:hypothetical protein